MTITTVSQKIHATETLITLGSTLTTGSYINSGTAGVINNVPVDGTTVSYDLMDVFINFGTAGITTGTASPTVTIAMIDSPDGTIYITPGTAAAQAPVYMTQSYPVPTSWAVTALELPNVQIRPFQELTLVQNNTGATWPSGTVITGVRKTIENF